MKKAKIWLHMLQVMGAACILTLFFSMSASAEGIISVPCNQLSPAGGILEYINTGGAFASQCNLRLVDQKSDVYSFTLPEEGWVFLKSGCTEYDYTELTLCYDAACTSQIDKKTCDKNTVVKAYLPAGTYYYQIHRWNGYCFSSPDGYDMITTTYLGYIPTSSVIKASKVSYSADKSYAKVTLSIDPAYVESINNTVGLRLVHGNVTPDKLYDNAVWDTTNNKNRLTTLTFKVNKNGTYSIRLTNTTQNEWYIAKTTISGLKGTPKAPKIKKAKVNTKLITGTAQKNTKIVLKIKGRTYKAKVNSKGTWKIKVKQKLKKSQKINAYVVNLYGTKSAVTYYVVKK